MKIFKKLCRTTLKIKPKYQIQCNQCGWIRLAYVSPSAGYTCGYNESSFCPKCNNCGGSVGPWDGEAITQPTGEELKKLLKHNKKSQKEILEYYKKHAYGAYLHMKLK